MTAPQSDVISIFQALDKCLESLKPTEHEHALRTLSRLFKVSVADRRPDAKNAQVPDDPTGRLNHIYRRNQEILDQISIRLDRIEEENDSKVTKDQLLSDQN